MRKASLRLRESQSGLVSIIVTMIIMITLSLIVIGFAQLARREERQALDRQLNSQAFYAAESGVNDAVRTIKTSATVANKTTCGPNADFPGPYDVSAADGVSYTCLLVDQTPTTLKYDNVDADTAPVVNLHTTKADGTTDNPLQTLHISWQATDNSASFETAHSPGPGNPEFPRADAWVGNTGLLRTALTQTEGSLTRDSLLRDTFTTYLYPNGSNASIVSTDYSNDPAQQGRVVPGNCTNGRPPSMLFCNVDINIPTPGPTHFALRLKSVYKPVKVQISGDGTAGPVHFQGAQAVIDSTGRANDVLRRIQVRVSLKDTHEYPQYLLESADSVCKTLEVWPGGASVTSLPSPDTACELGP